MVLSPSTPNEVVVVGLATKVMVLATLELTTQYSLLLMEAIVVPSAEPPLADAVGVMAILPAAVVEVMVSAR